MIAKIKTKVGWIVLLAGLAGLTILAACQPAQGAAKTQTFTVILGEGEVLAEVEGVDVMTGEFHRWEPDTLVVNKGDKVILTIKNPRGNIHSFSLPDYNLDTGPLEPRTGEVTLEFVADKPGVFRWQCNIPFNAAEGQCDIDHGAMVGYLLVLDK